MRGRRNAARTGMLLLGRTTISAADCWRVVAPATCAARGSNQALAQLAARSRNACAIFATTATGEKCPGRQSLPSAPAHIALGPVRHDTTLSSTIRVTKVPCERTPRTAQDLGGDRPLAHC